MGTMGRFIKEYGKTHSAQETAFLLFRLLGLDGGTGSGNFGHSGRPGKVGGSQKGSGGSAFRSGSKEGGYTSFANTKAFRGISSSARASSSYGEFVDKMSDEQRNALRDQRIACGTSENMSAYARRIYEMLHNRETKLNEIRQRSKPVDGKDISMTWQYQGEEHSAFSGSTKAIDTDIEDVLHQQGFDGLPKIVSHAEFERITKEHPEMPILMRSYAASSPEELAGFDKDLESGWFYVDCGNGGAQYGQGMYCAGIYPQDPVKEWNETEMDPNGWTVLTIRGEGFKAQQVPSDDFRTPTDLIADYPYVIVTPDGKKHLVRQDSDSTLYENLGEGGLYHEDELEKLMQGSKIYECLETDVSAYAKTEEETRKRLMNGAMEEMRHYRNASIDRIKSENIAIAPAGKEKAHGLNASGQEEYYYFDPDEEKPLRGNPPKDGDLIAINDGHIGGVQIYRVEGEKVVTLDGTGKYYTQGLAIAGYSWAPIEGKCERPEIDPKATTRMMTLDPSAKICTWREIRDIQEKAEDIRRQGREKIFANEIKHFRNEPMGAFNLYNVMMGRGTSGLDDDEIRATAKYRDENPDKVKEIQAFCDQQNETKKQYEEEARKYDRFTHMDVGVLASMLGYDAINAEGHGESGSYTVVLNRTKVILDEDSVDV